MILVAATILALAGAPVATGAAAVAPAPRTLVSVSASASHRPHHRHAVRHHHHVNTRTRHGVLVDPDSVARECLRVTHSPHSWKLGVRTIMDRESSNRPGAVNKWDGNAAAGADMESKGLMQTVGPTFRANHVKGTSWNIYNPVSNCASAVMYIKHTYGTIFNVQQANPNLPPKGY